MLNTNYVSIEYQAQEKLMLLAEKIADSRKTSRINAYLDRAAKIRYYLKAVSYKTTYLTDDQVNNIYLDLIDVSEINDFPVTPSLPTLSVPTTGTIIIIQGTKGDKGDTGSAPPLADGKVYIGDINNLPVAQTLSGAITTTNTGVTSLSSGVVVNANISASAAIDTSKLSALPDNNTAVVTNGSGKLTTVTGVSSTEVGYLANVTSDIQTQLDSKVGSTSGAISTVVSSNLNTNRAVVSNGSGKITDSTTTSAEIGYVSGVTSAIQTQLNARVLKAGDTMSGNLAMGSNKITGLAAASSNGEAVRYEQLTGKADVAQSSWSGAITLINGWSGTIKYRVDTLGMCHLTGLLVAFTASGTIVTNTGAVPNCVNSGSFIVPTGQDPAINPAARQVKISPTGQIYVYSLGLPGDFLDLEGIHYWTV